MIALYYRSRMQPWRFRVWIEDREVLYIALGHRRWGFMWAIRGDGEQA